MKKTALCILSVLIMAQMSCAKKRDYHCDLILRSANIIDINTGEVVENQNIALIGDSIAKIEAADVSGSWIAEQEINASGKYVIPGLWDMHIHFGGGDTLVVENKNLLPLFIANGVTTVRDCAADLSLHVIDWKDKIAQGKLLGPNIFTSGPKIEGINSIWPGDQEIANEEELLQALDSLEKMGADFVKITDNALGKQLFEKAVKAAHERGFKVSGHIPFGLRAVDLSKEGLSTVEHMGYMLKAGSPEEHKIIKAVDEGALDYSSAQTQLYDSFDTQYALSIYKEMAENQTAVVPTMIGNRIISYLDENDHKNDPELHYLGPGLIKTYEWRVNSANKADAAQIERRKARYVKLVSLLPIIKKSGMDIIAGTDAGFLNSYIYPGFSLHDELQIYVDGGLTPLEALQTSVVNGPKFFGLLDHYGSVEVGKKADLLILNTNPIQNIKATEDIHALIRSGKAFDRTALDSLLLEQAKTNF